MFEKSKSAITFKEFQDKLNIVNNFESDWGHFYDTDYNTEYNNNNINNNILFKDKPNMKPTFSKKNYFVDIEKQEKQKKEENPKLEKYNYEEKKDINEYKDERVITIIKSIFDIIQITFITITIGYFIFKII